MENVIYTNEKGISVRSVPTFLGDCFIIHDAQKGTNIELMSMQFKSMMNRLEDGDYGSFPHGGFDVTKKSIKIYHDGDKKKHTVKMRVDDLIKMAESILR